MIFTVKAKNGDIIRRALVDRGWVEKLSPSVFVTQSTSTNRTKLNVQRRLEKILLSNLVKRHPSNFVWDIKQFKYRNYLFHDDSRSVHSIRYRNNITSERNYPIKNQLEIEALWATLPGLCCCAKESNWSYIENVAEINTPRIYIGTTLEEKEFIKDYLLTACTSLLKWVLTKVANNEPIFNGNITCNVFVFAVNRCKEFLFTKQNRDIDNSIHRKATPGQWNFYLKSYYSLIDGNDVFMADKTNALPLLLAFSKILLKKIHKYRPQLSCEGFHNIWILKSAKPGAKELKMASKLRDITDCITSAPSGYVIQKYIGKKTIRVRNHRSFLFYIVVLVQIKSTTSTKRV